MNERIKELIIETDEWLENNAQSDRWEREIKFAELIIAECEKVAKNPQWYSESSSNGWRNPIRHVCREIKEHFGVEL
tara:strand:+ start:32 stop:262 length:231 start_codon:yes stop_codon:yes gene_type:complete